VDRFWRNSSWGKRLSLQTIEKIDIKEEDVIATLNAMLNATELLTEAVLRWSSQRSLPGQSGLLLNSADTTCCAAAQAGQ
jgi:hypothetical protein